MTARFGILCIGSFLIFMCSDIWNRIGPGLPGGGFFLVSIWIMLLGGLGLLCAGALSESPKRWTVALLPAVLFVQWVAYSSYAVTEASLDAPSDTVLVSLHAAVLNVLGENPYARSMYDVYSAYEATGQAMTPHLSGGQVESLPYPPLHFLVLRPILSWGLEGARMLYALSFSVVLALLFFYCPEERRPLILLPVVINPEFIAYPFYWSSDSVWTMLLVLILWFWEKPVVRAVLLGAACAYKQNPWLFAPFLAVRVVRESDRPARDLGLFMGLSVATFGLINLPFLWPDPGAWFRGVFDPMLSPYVPLGRGLSTLTQTGLLPFPKSYYSFTTWFLFACLVWLYFVDYRRLKPLLWLFPAIVLFFSYRSMQQYFIYSIPLFAMELSRLPVERPAKARLWYLPLAVAGAGLCMATVFLWPRPSPVSMKLLEHNAGGTVNEIRLEITNDGSERLEPIFFARSGWRDYPWSVQEGPLWVEPGAREVFTIGTDLGYRSIPMNKGGQVLLGDGTSSGRFLAMIDVPRLESFSRPRGVTPFEPTNWGSAGKVTFEQGTVTLQTTPYIERSTVVHQASLPSELISFELKRPRELPEQAFFGMEIRDNLGQRISLPLGDRESQGHYEPGHYYKVLPSSPGWNRYQISIRTLYDLAGFALPPMERIVRQDVELLERPIQLAVVLYSKTTVTDAAARNIKTDEPPPGRHVAELVFLENDSILLQADAAARRRKFDRALELYSQLWPFRSVVRRTQEGDFMVIPEPYQFSGRFQLAGSGWGEPESFPGGEARPTSRKMSTIRMLARPGLKLELKFYPPTSFTAQWDGGSEQVVSPGQSIEVPAPARVQTLTLVPAEKKTALQAIVAVD